MSETIDVMGGTQKEQWLTAIRIYRTVIEANVNDAITRAHYATAPTKHDGYPEIAENLETALRVLGDFADEMERLVKGVCNG